MIRGLLRLILAIFTFSSALLIYGQEDPLIHGAKRCERYGDKNRTTIDPFACFEAFSLYPEELDKKEASEDQISRALVKVGTIDQMAQYYKRQYLEKMKSAYLADLVLAQGMNIHLDHQKMGERALEDCYHSEFLAPVLSLLEQGKEIREVEKQDPEVERYLQDRFVKKTVMAYIESYRLRSLIKEYEKKGDKFLSEIEETQAALIKLFTAYPLILHIDKRGETGKNLSEKFIREYTDHGKGRNKTIIEKIKIFSPIDILGSQEKPIHRYYREGSNNGDPYLADILELPQSLRYEANMPGPHEKNVGKNLYWQIYEDISKDEKPARGEIEKLVRGAIQDRLFNSYANMGKLCSMDACETFELVPNQITSRVNEIRSSFVHQKVTQFICECHLLEKREETSLGLNMAVAGGALSSAIACLAFAPVCFSAGILGTAMGLAGTGLSIDDLLANWSNEKNEIKRSRQLITLSGDHAELEKSVNYISKQQDEFYANAALIGVNRLPMFPPANKLMKKVKVKLGHIKKIRIKNLKAKRRSLKNPTRENLIKNFGEYSPTTVKQNSSWIKTAKSGQEENNLFLDIENAAMKSLNNRLNGGDKELVTALTNVHKKLIDDKILKLKRKFPEVNIDSYSDYKSVRYAVKKPVSKEFETALALSFKEANEKFEKIVRKIPNINLGKERVGGWFKAGFGDSADQAGLAAREARGFSRKGGEAVKYKEITKQLEGHLETIKFTENQLFKELSRDGILIKLTSEVDGKKVLNNEVFEFMRKNHGSSKKDFIDSFEVRFGYRLKRKNYGQFRMLNNKYDKFSPGIWLPERKIANLDQAAHGGFTADFTGMGAYNLRQIAIDLGKNGDLGLVIKNVRKGEVEVTKVFNKKKNDFTKFSNSFFKKNKVEVRMVCSGDDCVGVPKKELRLDQQKRFMAEFAQKFDPSSIRVSFIGKGVKQADRTKIASHGEEIEKVLRKRVTGVSSSRKIDPEKMKKVTLGVVMPTNSGVGGIRLVVGTSRDLKLSKSEIALLRSNFKESVRKMNNSSEKDVSGKHTHKVRYHGLEN